MPSTFQLGGLVDIEDPVISGVFPLGVDFDVIRNLAHPYIIHKFGLKKEQRILTSKGSNSWRLSHGFVPQAELADFYTFYDAHRLPSNVFYFYDPYESTCPDLTGVSTVGRYVVRFKDNELDFDALRDLLFAGSLELIEVNTSTTVPHIGADLDFDITPSRKPRDTSGGGVVLGIWGQADLTGDVDIVPMCTIMPKAAAQPNYIHVSDRLCEIIQITIGGPSQYHGIYVPRLLDWEFSQQIGEGDKARFVMDNSDQIWDSYANQMDLGRAIISFTMQTGTPAFGRYLLKLWRGYIVDWNSDRTAGTFTIECEGGFHSLNHKLPRRMASTTCWLTFNDGFQCPYTAQGSGGNPGECDKGLDTPNGCNAHGMTNYFQGVVVKPQTAKGLLPRNSESAWQFGRRAYTTTSTPLKGIQDTVIPLVYGDGRQIVEGKIFEFRDESEFKVASAIVTEGPLVPGSIGKVLLDGQAHHFVPGQANPGIRALGEIGQDIGTIIDPDFRSSQLTFVSMRVNDEIGVKSAAENHTMLVEILDGLHCAHIWFWSGPFDNWGWIKTSNPVIIAHDLLMRSVGLHPVLPDGHVERNFLLDMFRYTHAAVWCELEVPSLEGSGTEKRFEFRGVCSEQKPAIEHMRDVIANTPIDIIYTYGNVAFKVRQDDVTTPQQGQVTFEHGVNILQGTFHARRWEPRFNEIKLLFADEALDFKENSVTLYDRLAQIRIGIYDSSGWNTKRALVKQTQVNLTGTFRRSQAVRLGMQLLYEELGGATEAEQLNARTVELEAALLGLAVEIGDVSRIVHPDLPGGQAFVRWESWSFSNEWKVRLKGRTVTASMYSSVPLQAPSMTEGEVMDFPLLTALVPPVLTMVSCTYATAVVGISTRPDLTNYLVFQAASTAGFTGATEQILPAITPSVTLAGTAGVTQFFRAKWRRTLNPLEESGWSNTVECDFPKVDADDISSVPEDGELVAPPVPVVRAVFGWSEFIEVSLTSAGLERGDVEFHDAFATNINSVRGSILIRNRSSDPNIEIIEAQLICADWGFTGADDGQAYTTAGFIDKGEEDLDPNATLAGWPNCYDANFLSVDPSTPLSLPKQAWDFLAESSAPYAKIRYTDLFSYPGSDVKVCPQESTASESINPAYHCKRAHLAKKIRLFNFSESARGVANPFIRIAFHARSLTGFISALGRTALVPYLPDVAGFGYYGAFAHGPLLPAQVKVKFSTGLTISLPVTQFTLGAAGIRWDPPAGAVYQLDDYFLFISDGPFSATLDAPSGKWEDMLEELPAGVSVARVGRESNLIASNWQGTPLEPGKVYYFRVGARRPVDFTQLDGHYLFSPTLSAEYAGQLNSETDHFAEIDSPAETAKASPSWQAPVSAVTDLPAGAIAGDVRIVTNLGAIYSSIGGLWQRLRAAINAVVGVATLPVETLVAGDDITFSHNAGAKELTINAVVPVNTYQSVGEFLFGVPGLIEVRANASFPVPVPKGMVGCVLTGWRLIVEAAGNGDTIIDINRNGTTLWSTQANRPKVGNALLSSSGTTFNTMALSAEDVLTLDVDVIPGLPPTKLSFHLYFRQDAVGVPA